MPKVNDIYAFINSIAPYSLQESYDNSGKNVVFGDREVTNVLLALDITNEVLDEAIEKNADLIITHHPVIFRGLKTLDSENIAVKLCMNGISAISAHTNFDSALMNDVLCTVLGFFPSDPLTVDNNNPVGKVCELDRPISASDLAKQVKQNLGNTVVRYIDTGRPITKVAVCGGSGGSFMNAALRKGCEAYITGDVKHDVFVDAHNAGLCVMDAGHFHTENIFCEYMKEQLEDAFEDVCFTVAENNRDILSYEI